ncbi:MAG: thiamine phosphate synthase [Gemmatimonadetes bacterium]|nr:thiamine phosphate synthase [Gemmatimonadota bacterium]NNK62856.1 thiamine phosphate synthase [Gemmatimonadota bacterium]
MLVLTDAGLAAPRPVVEVVQAVLEAGVRSIQLRDKTATARELHTQAQALLALTRRHGALLLVNDRVDVALAAGADGAHLGPNDLSIAGARQIVPPNFIVGYSCDDPVEARAAMAAGADYIGCGAVFGTTSKDVGGEAIGLERLDAVAGAVAGPTVAIGGIDDQNVHRVAATRATGVAVVSSVMAAPDPGAVAGRLVAAFAHRD